MVARVLFLCSPVGERDYTPTTGRPLGLVKIPRIFLSTSTQPPSPLQNTGFASQVDAYVTLEGIMPNRTTLSEAEAAFVNAQRVARLATADKRDIRILCRSVMPSMGRAFIHHWMRSPSG